MSQTRSSKKSSKLAFVDKIIDLSMRGDISAFTSLLKGYWEDKKKYPWNRVYPLVEKYWEKERPKEDLGEALVNIRDGIFGALDIHSLSLALDIPTPDILDILLKAKDWNEGRKRTRLHCSKEVGVLISKFQLDFLDVESLTRDGFGYLVGQLINAQLNQYRQARPQKEKGSLNLKSLHSSVHGRLLLRELGITASSVSTKTQEAANLLQAYENRLIELETDTSQAEIPLGPTEQLTLEGAPIEEYTPKDEEKRSKSKGKEEHQTPLTEYMTGKKASRERRKKRIEKSKTKTKSDGSGK
ncbi:MAG: hypothetical protein ACFFEJ_17540 [Candidatus Thorarchaeota archaeon]